MSVSRFLRFAVVAALGQATLNGCSRSTTDTTPDNDVRPVQVAGNSIGYRFDQATIDSASIGGDILLLYMSHGGCTRHTFELLASGVFLESYPVQVPALLAHDGKGEQCRAMRRPIVRFDLTALKRTYQKAYGPIGVLVLQVKAPGEGGKTTSVRYDIK